MQLKYTGPKEIISAHGISFKNGKDDKYVYINSAVQIYKAIHHDYKKDVVYTHKIEEFKLNDEELLTWILSLRDNLKQKAQTELENLKAYLRSEIEENNNHKEYNEEEQKVYKNNLEIMNSYQIQRGFNKIIYNILIEIIVDDIYEHRLKVINTPFNEKFWHLLQTIQGELSNHHKRSIGSKLETKHTDDSMNISLKINAIGK